jgi:DNA polymerase
VAINAEKPFIVDGPDIPYFLHKCIPSKAAACSHNALFDFCVFSWVFGWTPALILDTLAISRTLLSHKLKSLSLRSVAKYLGLPEKGGFLAQAKGMTRLDLIANGMWQQYCDYCINDTELCRLIFIELAPFLPDEEFLVHDMVARCAVEPRFRLNMEVLAEHLHRVKTEKEIMFAKAMFAGVDHKGELMSNPQFADVLRRLGVDPPLKLSPTTGQVAYAFSRNDPAFLELREHEDLRVQAVVEARLGHKSTLEETRTERMLNIGNLSFPHHGGTQVMPIPLKIGAAITHRLGGDWLLNCQNWGRQSPIRRSVQAPAGMRVVASDAAQIEARLTAWFCGQQDMVEQFRQGLDVYALFATTVYGYPVNKSQHPTQRFVGKTGVLQLGYQAGWPKFQKTVFILSGKEGLEPVELSDEDSMKVVTTYRETNDKISGMWSYLGHMIAWMANAVEGEKKEMGPVTFMRHRIVGPNGLCLYYENLRWNAGIRQWEYDYHGITTQIFGGKLLENIVQFLARIATMQAALRIKKRLEGYLSWFVHQAHDELVYLVREDYADYVGDVLSQEMSRTPDWAPGLPLKGETRIGLNYGECK